VPPRDHLLLLQRVAGQPDDLHAVEEGRLNRVEDVRGRDEEDPGEVVRDRQVVIAEGVVLLRVEDFQQRRGRDRPGSPLRACRSRRA
jgi:hypothetical protein